MSELYYYDGLKYQVARDYVCKTPVTGYHIDGEFFRLETDGTLRIFKGFAWDGASGLTFDTKSSMAPSLVHDVFCILLRARLIDFDLWQDKINEFFDEMCEQKGMWKLRARIWYRMVELADAGDPAQGPDRPIITAP